MAVAVVDFSDSHQSQKNFSGPLEIRYEVAAKGSHHDRLLYSGAWNVPPVDLFFQPTVEPQVIRKCVPDMGDAPGNTVGHAFFNLLRVEATLGLEGLHVDQ